MVKVQPWPCMHHAASNMHPPVSPFQLSKLDDVSGPKGLKYLLTECGKALVKEVSGLLGWASLTSEGTESMLPFPCLRPMRPPHH